MSRRIGLLGGSFDPIHVGHTALALRAMEAFGLGRVHLLVCRKPPHKEGRTWADSHHRFAMAALSTASSDTLVPDALELEQGAPPHSYTVDTLARFHAREGTTPGEALFIAGGDSLRDFHFWKDWEGLVRDHRFLFAMRAGVDTGPHAAWMVRSGLLTDGREWCKDALSEFDFRSSIMADLDLPDVSSTRVRAMVASGGEWRPLVPPPAVAYINKLKLYGST